MKKYYPSFYDKFSCLCDACPDTCCAKWEIVVDDKTVAKYNDISGEFGEKLRNSLYEDEDGDCLFILNNGRCPFLNCSNLCDIHITLGREFTCDVCRQHPDFVEEYDDFIEICPSLSCPETIRLLFDEEGSDIIYPDVDSGSDDYVLQLLIAGRRQAFVIAVSDDVFSKKSEKLCQLAREIQNSIELDIRECKTDFDFQSSADFCLSGLEILTDEWKEMLRDIHTQKNTSVAENKMSVLLSYYIYRYFLKAVNDCDVITTVRFILFSVWFCEQLYMFCNSSFEEIARLYSKEIEHNTDNIEKLYEFLQ